MSTRLKVVIGKGGETDKITAGNRRWVISTKKVTYHLSDQDAINHYAKEIIAGLVREAKVVKSTLKVVPD